MAKTILRDVQIFVDGTDLSNRSNAVTINQEDDEQDVTAFTAQARQRAKGIPDGAIEVTFFQDFEAGSTHSVLSPLKDTDVPFPVWVIPTDATVSATNPAFLLEEALLFNYSPLQGSVGEVSTIEATFNNSGDAGLVEVTDPLELPTS